MGLDYNNSRTYIDVNESAKKINFLPALPGVYVYTGCDYDSAFFRKGKKRPLEIMLKIQQFIDTFSKLATGVDCRGCCCIGVFHMYDVWVWQAVFNK